MNSPSPSCSPNDLETFEIMPTIYVKDTENPELALKRFKRSCEKAGIPSELRRRERYEKPTTVRKRKRAAAIKRAAKKLFKERGYKPDRTTRR